MCAENDEFLRWASKDVIEGADLMQISILFQMFVTTDLKASKPKFGLHIMWFMLPITLISAWGYTGE